MTRSRDVSKGATRNEFVYTATTQQTTFSGNDSNSNSLSYTVGQIDVFVNGVRQHPADYTATNGTSVVLAAGASNGDTVQINAFGTFSVTDVLAARTEFDYTATAGQTTFSGSDNDSQSMSYTAGRIDVYLNGSHLNDTDDYVATNGTSVVLQSGASAGDILHVVNHGTVNLVSNILDTTLDLNGEKLVLDADADTSIHASTDDQIDIEIAGSDDFNFTANTFNVLDGSKVLIGGQSSDSVGGATCNLQLEGTSTADSSISLKCNTNGTTAPTLRFGKSRGTAVGSDTVVQDGDELGVIVFAGADGTDTETQGAVIIAAVNGTPGSNDLPTRLVFQTTADGASSTTERMRIGSTGEILFGKTSNNFGTAGGTFNDTGAKNGALELICDDIPQLALNRLTNDGTAIVFHKDSSSGGNISVTASTTAYNTTSDYRLKENIDYSWTATTRLKTLKPCRFNFTAEADNKIVDGFLAHEVSSVVPEAVQGDKDATRTANNVVKKADGTLLHEDVTEEEWTQGKTDGIYDNSTSWASSMTTPVYQAIDQSKLVPLLVKTVQEQQTIIEDLQSRVTTLEG
tara:strand:- start:1035 stop:2753 length:1719 start_codon:yes stop_codon:yes gene_type:complete